MTQGPHVVRAEQLAPAPATTVEVRRDAESVARVRMDAACLPGGHAATLVIPQTEAALATFLRHRQATGQPVLVVGAQSSLTGAATPFGEDVVVMTETFTDLGAISPAGPSEARITVQAGVRLAALQADVAQQGWFLPPVPAYADSTVGAGVVNNAAGAATFAYGTFRQWVERIRVVLATGDVLDLTRGQVRAGADGTFEICLGDGSRATLHVPSYRMPAVPKCSAGYFAAPGMDLVDLFIGSEGTLGVVTEVTLRVAACPAGVMSVVVFPSSDEAAWAWIAETRAAALAERGRGRQGLPVRAIEYVDRASLDLLAGSRADCDHRLPIPTDAACAVVVEQELSSPWVDPVIAEAVPQLARRAPLDARTSTAMASHPAGRLLLDLFHRGLSRGWQVALPGDEVVRGRLARWREAVPLAVRELLHERQAGGEREITKVAADPCVPFERLGEFVAKTREICAHRGLTCVIWGHAGDGNLHPNILPDTANDVMRGREALLALGEWVIAIGGSPMAEHGVGKNPVKQALMRRLYGDCGVAEMMAVKRTLDPRGILGRGNLFPWPGVGGAV